MKSPERLPTQAKSSNRKFRYEWASNFIDSDDVVLDAGCGSGYGKEIITQRSKKYFSVDYTEEASPSIVADLNEWRPDFEFDVFIGFESIEHVKNTENYVSIAKSAKKYIFLTCPASETISWNPFHVYDFSVPDILDLFRDENWIVEEHFLRIVKSGKLVQQCWRLKRV